MTDPKHIDGQLVSWGDRLFYPGNRRVPAQGQPRLRSNSLHQRAAEIRARIHATVVRRAPQVMVKVTGGGRGMNAILAHFRYITKAGRLEMEDEHGHKESGRRAVHDMAEDWRLGGTQIPEVSDRREAYNIMLSMPRGTDPESVLWAAREFAKNELADHKYVMVLHDHQANPHVHISVRAESRHGRRLNPRKADLQRWRETFAGKLRERGIEAEASRQATRGARRRYPDLWQVKAGEDGRLLRSPSSTRKSAGTEASRIAAQAVWREVAATLEASDREDDRTLARSVQAFADGMAQRPTLNPVRSQGGRQSPVQPELRR